MQDEILFSKDILLIEKTFFQSLNASVSTHTSNTADFLQGENGMHVNIFTKI